MNGYNFTERVRKVLALARDEAQRLRHQYVGTEHILLAIAEEGNGTAVAVLQSLGVDPAALTGRVLATVKPGPEENGGTDLPYTTRAKKVLELAMAEAREISHSYVGTEHLLLGLLAEEKGVAATVLNASGVTVESARVEVVKLVGGGAESRSFASLRVTRVGQSVEHRHLVLRRDPQGRDFLRHALATLAYRGGKALRGAPPSFATFSVAAGSRTPGEILAHIGDLLDWALSQAKGEEAWRQVPPRDWETDSARFHLALEQLDAYIAGDAELRASTERMFQGAIADALTHIGQLTMLRRLAGAPVRGENYSKADIARGRLGPTQTPPEREFD